MVPDVSTNSTMGESTNMDPSISKTAVRYQGKWYVITGKPFEPERQTFDIGWNLIKKGITPHQAYREWFKKEREDAKLLYPTFRKDE
jgi:hypothetical protein